MMPQMAAIFAVYFWEYLEDPVPKESTRKRWQSIGLVPAKSGLSFLAILCVTVLIATRVLYHETENGKVSWKNSTAKMELAGEGAMPLPTPASRRLEIAHHQRAVEEKPIEDVLSFPILLSDQIKDAIKEDDSFRLECSDDEEDRHNLIGDSEQRNGARSPGRSSFAIDGSKNRFVNPARFNFSCRKRFFPSIASNNSRSRSVKIASRMLVNPLFTVFNLFIRSRSAEILSAELVAVASQSVIDSAASGDRLRIQNLAMVCRFTVCEFVFLLNVNRLRRGEQPVLDSGFWLVLIATESRRSTQVEAEPDQGGAGESSGEVNQVEESEGLD
nr:uncharacterized protein LOC109192509 [Ipomoea batatas]